MRRPSESAKDAVKPAAVSHSYGFLNRMWELADRGASFGDAAYYHSMASVPASTGQLPSSAYNDAVRRETAKPMRLPNVISTDKAALPTKTAPASFTEFRRAPFDHVRPLELSYSHHGTLRRRYSADNASKYKNYSAQELDKIHGEGAAAEDAFDTFNERGIAPEQYREAELRRALQDAHMDSLMEAVKVAKMDAQRDPLIRALNRRGI